MIDSMITSITAPPLGTLTRSSLMKPEAILITYVEANKVYWTLNWGMIDGVEIDFDITTRKFSLFKEGAKQVISKLHAIMLFHSWKKLAVETTVVPTGFYQDILKKTRGKFNVSNKGEE